MSSMSNGLAAFLNREPGARKVFGKRELKIVEKQLRGVNLTQSEKNRLSRDIRKKLEFIRIAARFASEFELKKGADLKNGISEVLEVVKRDESFPLIRRIWLYGSAATNELTLSSDVDIAVEFKGHSEPAEFRSRVLGSLPQNIDLQVLNDLPKKVQKEVLETGRILYERKNQG